LNSYAGLKGLGQDAQASCCDEPKRELQPEILRSDIKQPAIAGCFINLLFNFYRPLPVSNMPLLGTGYYQLTIGRIAG
jgi:hypothetical protein